MKNWHALRLWLAGPRLLDRLGVFILTLFIGAYQAGLRPFLIGTCKFYPSCSEYCREAITTHGVLRGMVLAVGRVVRCHPWGCGGIDLVPTRNQDRLPHASERDE